MPPPVPALRVSILLGQRPLPEVTASNTGQLPPEVLEAVRLDHEDEEPGEDEVGAPDGAGRKSWSSLPEGFHARVDVDPGGFGVAKRCRQALKLWWPLLAGLSGGAGDPRLDCRSAALATLQDVLQVSREDHGRRVDPRLLLRVEPTPARGGRRRIVSER